MRNDYPILSKSDYYIDFLLLLTYSLLPGLYKIADNQLIMLFSLPITGYLLYRHWRRRILYRWDILFIFLLFYLFLLNLIQYFSPSTNRTGLYMGIFLDMIPMTGFIFSRFIRFEDFIKLIVPVGFMHLIIGILLYPLFGIIQLFGEIGNALTEGVMIGRMASVSGSLGFASLMFITSISALYYKKKYFIFLLLGVICSAQRSAWLACFCGILLFIYTTIRKGNIKHARNLITTIFIFVVVLLYLISTNDFDVSFFSQRFNEMDSAIGERNEQWVAGFQNFMQMPIGSGFGQVGQVAARYEQGVYQSIPDGDYLRILAEYGIMGGLFYIVIISLYIISLFTTLCHNISQQRCCIFSIMGGFCIQMLGSNITEFYFTSFLYWIFIGYLFIEYNQIFKSNAPCKIYSKAKHNVNCTSPRTTLNTTP